MVVFVSSTLADLAAHREVLCQKLAGAGYEIERMEAFGSSGVTPLETCTQAIERSDVSLMLLGFRYGSVVPNYGISFTEAEYEHAQALGHPTFGFLRDGFDTGVTGTSETADAKRQLRQLRATLETELAVDQTYFTTPDDLADKALHALDKWGDGSGRRPLFTKPLLDIVDAVAYGSKRTLRENARLLAPPVVLVDLSAARRDTAPPPRAGRLAAKLWIIKRELEEDGHKVLMFTSIVPPGPTHGSRFDLRLAHVLASEAIVVCFAKDDYDIELLGEFRQAGSARIIFWRDRPPPEDFPQATAERWTADGLRGCDVAWRAEQEVESAIDRAVLSALGTPA